MPKTTGSRRGRKTGVLRELMGRGFDRCSVSRATLGVRVGCSQCEALVINGHACHEPGCPNIPVRDEDVESAIAHEEQSVEDGQARWSETGSTRRYL